MDNASDGNMSHYPRIPSRLIRQMAGKGRPIKKFNIRVRIESILSRIDADRPNLIRGTCQPAF